MTSPTEQDNIDVLLLALIAATDAVEREDMSAVQRAVINDDLGRAMDFLDKRGVCKPAYIAAVRKAAFN